MSRDSCQPQQAIKPSSCPCTATRDEENSHSDKENDPEVNENARTRQQFVLSRKRKNEKGLGAAKKALKRMEMIESDPTEELVQLLKDDLKKSRQHEIECLKLLMNNSAPSTPPPATQYIHSQQTWQPEQVPNPQLFQGIPPPLWRHLNPRGFMTLPQLICF